MSPNGLLRSGSVDPWDTSLHVSSVNTMIHPKIGCTCPRPRPALAQSPNVELQKTKLTGAGPAVGTQLQFRSVGSIIRFYVGWSTVVLALLATVSCSGVRSLPPVGPSTCAASGASPALPPVPMAPLTHEHLNISREARAAAARQLTGGTIDVFATILAAGESLHARPCYISFCPTTHYPVLLQYVPSSIIVESTRA